MLVRQATEVELAARSRAGAEAGCPSWWHGQHQPHTATCSEPALLSVWLLALSAAAPKAEGKEESREKKLH